MKRKFEARSRNFTLALMQTRISMPNETVRRIEHQSGDAPELAKRTIGWITNTQTPLTVAELEHALAIEIGSPEFDATNITDIEQLTSYCCGLIIVDEEKSHVKLVHYTAQKCFENMWDAWLPEIHEVITDSCLTYVSYDVFEEERFQSEAGSKELSEEYPFYHYSSRNWGHHFREHPGDQSLAPKFLQSESKISAYDKCGYEPFTGKWTYKVKKTGIKAEHVAASFGLDNLMQKLFETSPNNVEIPDDKEHTPLFVAAILGREMVAKVLLDKGANANDTVRNGVSPLHVAAY
jgi:FOG: Ankyrin repeat